MHGFIFQTSIVKQFRARIALKLGRLLSFMIRNAFQISFLILIYKMFLIAKLNKGFNSMKRVLLCHHVNSRWFIEMLTIKLTCTVNIRHHGRGQHLASHYMKWTADESLLTCLLCTLLSTMTWPISGIIVKITSNRDRLKHIRLFLPGGYDLLWNILVTNCVMVDLGVWKILYDIPSSTVTNC